MRKAHAGDGSFQVGFLHKAKVLDFAGGNVVHVAAGFSGLMCSVVVGKVSLCALIAPRLACALPASLFACAEAAPPVFRTPPLVPQRTNFGRENFHPHNILISVLGAALLWVGWMGFNGYVSAGHTRSPLEQS